MPLHLVTHLVAQVNKNINIGSRQIATLLPEMKRTGAKKAIVSMCIGTGMGAAALIESEWLCWLNKCFINNFVICILR